MRYQQTFCSRNTRSAVVGRVLSCFRRMRWLWVCLLLACLVGVATAVPVVTAQAPNSDILLEVDAGYDGHYRTGQWFPITVVVGNDGPDIQGTLEWHFPTMSGSNAMVFEREIDLPRGSQKRVTMHATINAFARLGELQLMQGRTVVQSVQVRLEPIDSTQFVVGVLSSDTTLLNSLTGMTLGNVPAVVVLHPNAALLPEHARALDGLDALFVHTGDTSTLSPAQLDALDMWVHLGGQLVVSGGANADQTTAGIDHLLPVRLEGLESNVPLAPLQQLVRSTSPDMYDTMPEQTTASVVELLPDAEQLDSDGLLTAHDVGAGRVIFTAFDLAVLRGWVGEPVLWSRVLQAEPRFAPGAEPSWSGQDLLRDTLQMPELELPSFGLLFLFILIYIVIVGPANYFLLRRIQRPELAWVTIPALVLVFVLGTYGASFLARGVSPEVMQVSVVQGFEGKEEAHTVSYVSIFSPRRADYTLRFAPETLIRAVRWHSGSNDAELVWTDSTAEIRNALVDVSSLRSFVSEQTIALPFSVQSSLRHVPGGIEGNITNNGNIPLEDAIIVQGSQVQQIGTLAPGDTYEISDGDMFPFPDMVQAKSGESIFSRQSMLYSLFSYGRMNYTVLPIAPSMGNDQGMFDPDSFYLMAWREEPLTDVQVNNAPSRQQGLTLYVVRLNSP